MTRRVYRIGASRLNIDFGDIVHVNADVIVSSDDSWLSAGGGVSAAIRQASGTAAIVDATKWTPCRLGDIAVTTAGALPAKLIFHVVTITDGEWPSEGWLKFITLTTTRCLDRMQALGLRSIALPALGTGAAGIPIEVAAAGMANAIFDRLIDEPTELEVSLQLLTTRRAPKLDLVAFYEEFAKRAPEVKGRVVADPVWGTTHPLLNAVTREVVESERERQKLEAEVIDTRAHDSAANDELLEKLRVNQGRRIDAAATSLKAKRTPIRVFVSYSHSDEMYRRELEKALSNLRSQAVISEWTDHAILPGQTWDEQIRAGLEAAQIILCLISADFMASSYIDSVEMKEAMRRNKLGLARVIPIIIRPTHWKGHPLASLQALPKNAKAVSLYGNADEAYLDIADGIAKVAEDLIRKDLG